MSFAPVSERRERLRCPLNGVFACYPALAALFAS